jgi:Uma2 family endonuclease
VAVVCGSLEIDPADKTRQTVLNPSVLIEVLSPSTEADDRESKLSSYKLIESVRAVVLVSQTRTEIILHTRQSDESWPVTTHASGSVRLAAIDCELPLDEIYENLPEEV